MTKPFAIFILGIQDSLFAGNPVSKMLKWMFWSIFVTNVFFIRRQNLLQAAVAWANLWRKQTARCLDSTMGCSSHSDNVSLARFYCILLPEFSWALFFSATSCLVVAEKNCVWTCLFLQLFSVQGKISKHQPWLALMLFQMKTLWISLWWLCLALVLPSSLFGQLFWFGSLRKLFHKWMGPLILWSFSQVMLQYPKVLPRQICDLFA